MLVFLLMIYYNVKTTSGVEVVLVVPAKMLSNKIFGYFQKLCQTLKILSCSTKADYQTAFACVIKTINCTKASTLPFCFACGPPAFYYRQPACFYQSQMHATGWH